VQQASAQQQLTVEQQVVQLQPEQQVPQASESVRPQGAG